MEGQRPVGEGMGILFVISAPSGAGKTTLAGMVLNKIPGLRQSISYTSRLKREEESDGQHYIFVDRKKFTEMAEKNSFIEWVELHGEFYGTTHESILAAARENVDMLMVIDVQGAENIKKKYQESVLVFILPPSLQALEERLGKRGTEHQISINKRIEEATREIDACGTFDYLVINEKLEEAAIELESIIRAERCRLTRRITECRLIFDKKK
jgi:guanylate kinase